jgi:hypothetical protein
MANITYRNSTTPTLPTSNTAKGTLLTFDEVDGNFKSLDNAITTVAATVPTQSDILAIAIALG